MKRHQAIISAILALILIGALVAQQPAPPLTTSAFIMGKNAAGNPQAVNVEAVSGSANTGLGVTGADGISNTGGVGQFLGNNVGLIQEVAPFAFNGSTWDRYSYCAPTAPTVINPTTATTTLLLGAVSAKTNKICALEVAAVAAQTVKLVVGTQTTNPCDTGAVTISATYQLAANQNVFLGGNVLPYVQGTAVNQQVCVVTSAAASVFVAAHSVTY